ncbi:hypothetical protein LTS10_000664 [Elasticomyces elasticus]|nr:hypothetical protein LTS10_000664 [Elasticomyces elasticus]
MPSRTIFPSTRAKSPCSSEYCTGVVEVKVGEGHNATSFFLHTGLLGFYSGYFHAALKRHFLSKSDGMIKLPEEDVDTFRIFVTWLYTGQISFAEPGKVYPKLLALWAFADRRGIPLLMNEAINAILMEYLITLQLPTRRLCEVYELTVPGAGLRRLVVHLISHQWNAKTFMAECGKMELPPDAYRDILCAVWRLKDERGAERMKLWEVGQVCEFHEYEEGVKCENAV